MLTSALMAAPAAAQRVGTPAGQADESADDNSGDIVVIGTKRNRASAIDQKRDSLRVIDALGADELGQLPEKNVGESLNRLPGVTMLVEKGEGRFVQIRGVAANLNAVTINGVYIGSPQTDGGGRQVPLDLIAGSVLGSVQVVKTPTPDMDAQGIGGTVNIVTKMPFDRSDKFYGYGSTNYGIETIEPKDKGYGGHDPYSVDGTISGKLFGDKLGWLVGGAWSDREYIAQGIYQDDFHDADGLGLPEEVKNNYYTIGRQRLNLNGALQFRPDNVSEYFVRGFYAEWDEYQHRNRFQEALTEDVTDTGDSGGTYGMNATRANLRLEDTEKSVLSIAAGGNSDFGTLKLDYLLQYNRNRLNNPYSYWEFESDDMFGPGRFTRDDDGIVTLMPDEGTADRTDPRYQVFDRLRYQQSRLKENAWVTAVNLRWNASDDFYLKVGAKGTQTIRHNDYNRQRYDPGSQMMTLATDPALNSGGFVNDVEASDVPNLWMNIDALNAFFDDPANAAYFERNDDDTFVQRYANDYDLTENIAAGYIMGVKTIGIAQIIGGVRYEYTDVNSAGYLQSDGEAYRIHAGGDYAEWLPSLIVNVHPTDRTILRGAVSRALGRPGYDTIAPISSYSVETNEASLSIGNPDLKPRTSWNFDASAEWYPNDLSAVTVGVFYKDIGNQITGVSDRFTSPADIQDALDANGLGGAVNPEGLTELIVSTSVNAGSAELYGIEMNGQTQFSFLPAPLDGLGVSLSATFLDGSTTIDGEKAPIEGQASETYAATLFYQKGPIDASLNYTYNGDYLTDRASDPDNRLNQGEFGRLDAKLTYVVSPMLKLFVQGVNLTNEPTTEFQGGHKVWRTEAEYVGTTVSAGINVGF
ncbi:TonB-dependent receptor [Stakelama saccharophila]|uniref:TonB-dependent receptor n=1 Tax=Stakelama saccharophila TaxID=3075605 RepID=A0ABZ0B932_9SPHN|nr:TonB-dependent receptor [Stakelama sp. W311]WNO53626.1 TonB-dependent receptor [Stakelama sp. W311]